MGGPANPGEKAAAAFPAPPMKKPAPGCIMGAPGCIIRGAPWGPKGGPMPWGMQPPIGKNWGGAPIIPMPMGGAHGLP
ncbi:hypothetical protein cyc_09395 [Cyclospora cayetanensis]|uniref:Uncharacterized protein n=1 Tax=Cyclospora cayetanensis TaxID=88456 RepID=A0A1D3D8E3_9EIME|nr:hypothetical protein cyc_09395 [Cyclospora cayetanensis]